GRGGCGRARVAAGARIDRSWIGFLIATLGLGISSRARRRGGRWLVSIGLALLLAPPTLEAASGEAPVRGDPDGEVGRTSADLGEGIMETNVAFRVTACHVADCPGDEQGATVLGGTLGGVTQVVGPLAAPRLGDRFAMRLGDARGLVHRLGPTFRP